jgi:hypothetical protein
MLPIAVDSILQSREEWDGDGHDRGGDRTSMLMEIKLYRPNEILMDFSIARYLG